LDFSGSSFYALYQTGRHPVYDNNGPRQTKKDRLVHRRWNAVKGAARGVHLDP
jgi:hypothetical protein